MHLKQGMGAVAALLLLSVFASSCSGGGGRETVFLYIINGYAGTQTMDIIGPTGTIATGVEFGDRMASGGPCPPGESCIPIEVDRSLGTNLSYRLEGMPQPVELDLDLFAMYPQETGTLVLTRRSGTPEVQVQLYRHVQTISSDCSLLMSNGLSLTNEFLPEGYNNFSIVPEFKRENVQRAGYVDETEAPFLTECGQLPVGTPEHGQLARGDLLGRVQADPWFFPVECTDDREQEVLCSGWGLPGFDGRARVFDDGTVLIVRSSVDYYQCISGAITIKQPESEMDPLPFPAGDAQVQCPEDPLTWDDVQVDRVAAEACKRPVAATVDVLEPGEEQESFIYFANPAPNDLANDFCDAEFRVRNIGQDIIFGPKGGELGKHQDGALVTSDITIPTGSQHFWVLLGRPVNPIIWQWDSGTTFVDLKDFPYLNDKDTEVGEYDSPR